MTATATVPRGKSRAALQVVPDPARLERIPLELVDVAENVRVDPGELEELAASIRELGVIQPIKVIGPGAGGRYRAVWGQRRILASRLAEQVDIPALVEAAGDVDAPGAKRSIEQLVENIQRADLGPIDEAYALRQVLDDDTGLTQADLAKRLGRSSSWVANTLALLEAPEEVRELIARGDLTASHAKAFKGLAPKTQIQVAQQVVSWGYSAHRTEQHVQDLKRRAELEGKDQARQREQAKARKVAWADAIARKLAKVDKATRIVVTEPYYYGNHGHATQAVLELLKAAGFTKAEKGKAQQRPAGHCDCTAWRAAPDGDRLTLAPACVKDAHYQARLRADDEKRRATYQLKEKVQARVKLDVDGGGLAWAGPDGSRSVVLDEKLARMALWNALGYRIEPWAKARGYKPAQAWQAVLSVPASELPLELARAMAQGFDDHFGYRVDWSAIADDYGLEDPTKPVEPAPAPAQAPASKGKAAPKISAKALEAARAELGLDGAD